MLTGTLLSGSPHPAGVHKAPARQLSRGTEPDWKFIQLKQTQPINCQAVWAGGGSPRLASSSQERV